MHDIKLVRKNPEEFDSQMAKRGVEPVSAKILELDGKTRDGKSRLQELQEQSNFYAKQIGQLKSKGENADEVISKSKDIKQQIVNLKNELENEDLGQSNPLNDLLGELPNYPAKDVPLGKTEEENVEVRKWGQIRKFDFEPKEHFDLGENLGLMDFEQTAKISGSRFVTLKGALARLERVLSNFMLDLHVNEYGYQEVSPPLLVRDKAFYGSGQLPKFAEDSFATTNDYRLIPTSEVSLVNMVRESIIEKDQLPLRFVANTPCFRSEAGSAGKDTRGMIRMHQFQKVELVTITDEESSEDEFERMTGAAEIILQKLNIPYRVILKCIGDTSFTAHKTYDLELWLPGQGKYREVSSCSTCGSFQARRMNARYRAGDKDIRFVHTLNGSGVAVGRCLIAILENYQNEDGTIDVPEILQPYMGVNKIL